MGLREIFFKKKTPFLSDDDIKKLLQIKRDAYLKTAEELMKKQGEDKANKELGIKQKKENF